MVWRTSGDFPGRTPTSGSGSSRARAGAQDGSLFFHPEGERGPSRVAREEAAKQVCARCPVVDPCRAHALSAREPYGVWGGMSESERDEELAATVGVVRLIH